MSQSSTGTSISLLERLRDLRDADAWRRLVALYTPSLTAWLRAAGFQAADRDDLVQQVLAVLFKKLPHFEHSGRPGAFRRWLHGITVNAIREFLRGRRPGEADDAVLAQIEDPASGISQLWEKEYNCHTARALLELVERDFAPSTSQAFRRLMLDGVSATQVAQELGMSVNAVWIVKSRVLARLRQEGQGLID